MPRLRLPFLVTGLLLLTGCLQVEMHFKVRSDGSGTLTTRIEVPAELPTSQMGEMGMGEVDPFSEEGARQQAYQYGPGVRFVRSRKIDSDGRTGLEAVYEFDDISLVKAAPFSSEENSGMGSVAAEEVTFGFTADGNGRLTIDLPDPDPAEQAAAEQAAAEPLDDMALSMQAGMMKGMMAGMYVIMTVEIVDGIASANTRHVSGNVVTVYEVDFDRIAANDDNLKEYLRTQDDMSRARHLTGVTYPENDPIIIEFGEPSFHFPSWAYYAIGGLLAVVLILFLATKVEIRIG